MKYRNKPINGGRYEVEIITIEDLNLVRIAGNVGTFYLSKKDVRAILDWSMTPDEVSEDSNESDEEQSEPVEIDHPELDDYTFESASQEREDAHHDGFESGLFAAKRKAENIVRKIERKPSKVCSVDDVIELIKEEFNI